MCISCVSLGAYYYVTNNAISISISAYEGPDISWIAVTSVSVYIVGFAMSWGPIPWLLMSEVFPVKARGTASGVATAFNWLCSFVITKTFAFLVNALFATGTFWLYGILAFIAVVFVFVFVPETKGKSFERFSSISRAKKREKSNSAPVRESDV